MVSEAERAVARFARTQHGVWARAQALAAGLTPRQIERRLGAGHWIRLDSGVYASPSAAPTWQRGVMAAVLAEPWAVASHRSAARLHGLVGFRSGRPEITVPPGANTRGRLAIAHRGTDVRSSKVDGIPCVTIDQVFIDLAQVVSVSKLGTALARRVDGHPRTLEAVRERYARLAPRGGRDLRNLRTVLDRFGAGDDIEESALEAAMRRLFTRPSIPAIVWQAPFPGREPSAHRVDGSIEEWKLILEGDGRAWHTRVDDFERDRRRDQAAAAAGYLTMRYTWHQIQTDSAWCVSTLIAAGRGRGMSA